MRNRYTRGDAASSTSSSPPEVTTICGAATLSTCPPRLSSSLCWPSSVQTRIRGGAALNVKTYCPPTANPVSVLFVADSFPTATQAVIQDPSDEYFSIRPVFGYATNAVPSGMAATSKGRSSVTAEFCGTFQD